MRWTRAVCGQFPHYVMSCRAFVGKFLRALHAALILIWENIYSETRPTRSVFLSPKVARGLSCFVFLSRGIVPMQDSCARVMARGECNFTRTRLAFEIADAGLDKLVYGARRCVSWFRWFIKKNKKWLIVLICRVDMNACYGWHEMQAGEIHYLSWIFIFHSLWSKVRYIYDKNMSSIRGSYTNSEKPQVYSNDCSIFFR